MKRIGSILILSLICSVLSAQSKTEPTITVSADGATKNEATMRALRSAIEQTMGTFVVSSTSLLNDKMTQDEIETISNGSIKEYREVSSEFINGRYYVTLTATVSLKKLFDYSQKQAVKKGVTIQIDGEILNNNFQLARLNHELNKKAERLAIENMIRQLEELTKSVPLLDYEMELSEPRKTNYSSALSDGIPEQYNEHWAMSGKLEPRFNDNTARFFDILISTIEAVSVGVSEAQDALKYNFELYTTGRNFGEGGGKQYVLRNPLDSYKYANLGIDLLFVQRIVITDGSKQTTDLIIPGGGYIYDPTELMFDRHVGRKIENRSEWLNYIFPFGYVWQRPTFGLYYKNPNDLCIGNKTESNGQIAFMYKNGDQLKCMDDNGDFCYAPYETFSIWIPENEIVYVTSFSARHKQIKQEWLDLYDYLCDCNLLYGDYSRWAMDHWYSLSKEDGLDNDTILTKLRSQTHRRSNDLTYNDLVNSVDVPFELNNHLIFKND